MTCVSPNATGLIKYNVGCGTYSMHGKMMYGYKIAFSKWKGTDSECLPVLATETYVVNHHARLKLKHGEGPCFKDS